MTNVKIIHTDNFCIKGKHCTVTGLFLYHTLSSSINNSTTFNGAVVLQNTENTSLNNMTLSYSQMFANYTLITTISNATVMNSINVGISSISGTDMALERVSIRNTTDGHCIRIGFGHNTSIIDINATHCKGNGIEIRGATNTFIRDSFFANLGTPLPTSAAIGLLNTYKTSIQNITVHVDYAIYSIVCVLSRNCHISDIYIIGSQSLLVLDSKYTTLQNVTVVNSISGVELFNSAKIQVLNSTIAITTINDSTTAVSISLSSDVLLHNITINSSVEISVR